MATQLNWDDGSGDKFTIDLQPLVSGNPATIVSDTNYTGKVRNKVITFHTQANSLDNQVSFNIKQFPDSQVVSTMQDTTSIYDETKGAY